ncbi:MAG TPA: bifunctional hydroxymethylpyrimidine kinase/phosphomethylpyrimidine kinase, partial [Candidatus Bathyarchaeota archaeon]|nr:bifunctional hydroxymethylpyrimidine kinase/phosphomethylpyrimidine kinase [Candidatus Bathyarchaeota archaeon]
SDSSGGAGVEADLKTFSALGVFGTCVITAITAQNTKGVKEIFPIPPRIVRAQIQAVLEDIPVKTVKTGMLYSREIMGVIAEFIDEYDIRLVTDPIFRAGTGRSLIIKKDIDFLIDVILPRAEIITPNIFEAEVISGIKIGDLDDMKEAARRIANHGAKSVIIKGGHLRGDEKVCDLLYHEGAFRIFEKPRLKIKPHGGGCVFSAAIASFLARGDDLENAVENAERFIEMSFIGASKVGSGNIPVNPVAYIYNEAEKVRIMEKVEAAAATIVGDPRFLPFAAEVGIQLAMASPYPRGREDVAAIDGRIVKVKSGLKAAGPVRFGASRHIADIILTAMRYNPKIRAAMNLHYDQRLIEAFRRIGCKVACFDRRLEPDEVRRVEGRSLRWGVEDIVRRVGYVPDVIYDEGDVGKEPMIRILGRSILEVTEKALKAIESL